MFCDLDTGGALRLNRWLQAHCYGWVPCGILIPFGTLGVIDYSGKHMKEQLVGEDLERAGISSADIVTECLAS